VRPAAAFAVFLSLTACGSTSPAPVDRPNVLLVTIDSLRADRVGRGLTPAIDGLAARGTRYTQARATVPLTLPSHASILTGTLPPGNGVRRNGDVLQIRPTLARAFHDAGYRTAAFVGASVLDRRFGLSGGFDTYDDRIARDPSGDAGVTAERRGNSVADAGLAWLQQRSMQPFFVWVHFYDPHAPYDPPQEYLEKANGNAYDGEVAFADAQVGRLLDCLRDRALEASTIVVVTADHGEGLGDHGEATHGLLAYDSTIHVPLVVAVPGAIRRRGVIPPQGAVPPEGGSDTGPVSLADLAGTLLAAAGVAVPDGMRKGPLGAGGDSYAETMEPERAGWHTLSVVAFDRWTLIASSNQELYDVSADPGQIHDRGGEQLAVVDTARRRLAAVAPASHAAIDDAPDPARGVAAWNTFERQLIRLASGDARGALPDLTRLARAYPDAPAFQAAYARALKDVGRPRQAVDLYRRLVARWPQDAAMYHDLATAARAAGMPDEALHAERASLAVQPSNAAASNGLGLLLLEQGATADAVGAFERATEDDPSNAAFWVNLGQARREAGDSTRAEQAYAHALEIDPRSADAANGMGLLLLHTGRAPQAMAWFERALAGSPRFFDARLNLAAACLESGNKDRAIDAYRRVIGEATPGSREYLSAQQSLAQLKQ